MTQRIALAGWYGSDNLGDELILRSLLGGLQARGAQPVVITINATRTQRDHEVETVTHCRPSQSRALRRVLRDVDGLAIAGGVIQSETSPWNIPFHLSRLRAAETRMPMAAMGMGVGHVHGMIGRSMSRKTLKRLRRIVVRDTDSAQRLTALGLRDVVVGADPVIALEPPPVDPDDTMCVILRPANRGGPRTAAGKAKRATRQHAALDRVAQAIEAAASTTGLRPRFVAFQASRDGPLHEEVAKRLSTEVEVVTPDLHTVLDEVGRSRLVVTMRYHGAIAALLHNRAAVLLNYSPKMASLGKEAGGWASLQDIATLNAHALSSAVAQAVDARTRASEALGILRGRLAANDAALDELAAVGN